MTATKLVALRRQSPPLLLLLLLLLLLRIPVALTRGHCPAADAACRCDGNDIICEDLGQRDAIPAFDSSASVFSTLSFRGSTRVLGIQARAFAGLRVGTIDVSGAGLTFVDQAAFQDVDAAELQELVLANNSLQELPSTVFANLTSLKVVDLRNNCITRLHVDTFSALRSSLTALFLSDNRLTTGSLPSGILSQMDNLTTLEIEDNQLTRWSSTMLFGSTEITELSLAGNRFTTFPSDAFEGLEKLVTLRLGRSSIAMLASGTFRRLASLQELDLSGNRLADINAGILQGLASLETLDLSINQLSDLPSSFLSPLTGLKSLDLSHNLLRQLPAGLFVNTTLTLDTINLSWNNLTVTNDTFRGLSSLTKLFLAGNSICAISSSLFSDLNQLSELDLSDNKIVDMEPGLLSFARETLTCLNLSGNKISRILPRVFHNGPVLEKIDLSRNKIRIINAITFENLGLRSIDLSHNEIEFIHPDAFTFIAALSMVYLNHNRLTRVPSMLLYNIAGLTDVDLDYNLIDSLPAGALSDLWVDKISLTWNKISSIDQQAFANLSQFCKSIDLSGNRIAQIPNNTFSTLSSVSHLSLSHNRLTQVTNGTFAGLNALRSLDLSNNRISTVANGTFSAFSLSDLRLDGNRLEPIAPSAIGTIATLRTLNLSSCGLTDQSLEAIGGLSGLTELYLDANNLTSLQQLPDLASLGTLSARNNGLSDIDYNRSGSITVLDLGENRLGSDTLASGLRTFPNLKSLKLDGNKLGAVPADAFSAFASKLEELDLSKNDLSSISLEALVNLTSIRVLTMDDNQLRDISSLATAPMSKVLRKFSAKHNHLNSTALSVLSNFTELCGLFLDGNEVDSIPYSVFQSAYSITMLSLARNVIRNVGSDAFNGLQQTCQHLDLSNNGLLQVHQRTFSVLKNLEHLDLSDNNITLLTLPPNMPRLRVLLLGGNRLQTFPAGVRLFLKISAFSVSRNSMVTLPSLTFFGNSSDRTVLVDFQENGLLNVGDVHLIGSFGRVDFSGNNLTDLPHKTLTRAIYVDELDLSRNKFELISPTIWESAFAVNSLNMSRNDLKLSVENFSGNKNNQCGTVLTTLDLSNNSLSEFPPGQIASLSSSLAVLDIRNNNFTTLPESDFRNMTELTYLYLAENPWNCDCSLVWIRQLEHVFVDNATCLVPPETLGHLVVCYEPPVSCPLDQPMNDSRCLITQTLVTSTVSAPPTSSSAVTFPSSTPSPANMTSLGSPTVVSVMPTSAPDVSTSESTSLRPNVTISPTVVDTKTTSSTPMSFISTVSSVSSASSSVSGVDVTTASTSESTMSSLSSPSSVSVARTETAAPSTAATVIQRTVSDHVPDSSTSGTPVSVITVSPVNVTSTVGPLVTSSEATNLTSAPASSVISTATPSIFSPTEAPTMPPNATISLMPSSSAVATPESTMTSLSPSPSVTVTRTETALHSTADNVTAPTTSVSGPDVSISASTSGPSVSGTAVSPVSVTSVPVTPSESAASVMSASTLSTAAPTIPPNATVSPTSAESTVSANVSNATATTKSTTPGIAITTRTTTSSTTRSTTVYQPSDNVTTTTGTTRRRTPGLPTKPSTTPGLPTTRRSTPGLNDPEPRAGPLQAVSSLELGKSDKYVVAIALGIGAVLVLAAIITGLVVCLCWRSG